MVGAMSELDPGFGHWLAGFIDGEGCFRIHVHKHRGQHDCRPEVEFRLALRDDDAPILDEIVARTGIGCVTTHRRALQGNQKPAVEWKVTGQANTAKLVRLLDTYPLRAKKCRDFEIWKRAVRISARNRRGPRSSEQTAVDWQLRQLARELGAMRRYRAPDDPAPEQTSPADEQEALFDLDRLNHNHQEDNR
jgi:hypothetical protein